MFKFQYEDSKNPVFLSPIAVVLAQQAWDNLKNVSFMASQLTSCDCENPAFVGIISTADPGYCAKSMIEKKKKVIYVEIIKLRPLLKSVGHVCRKWLRQKTTVGFFSGGQDTTYLETPLFTTP